MLIGSVEAAATFWKFVRSIWAELHLQSHIALFHLFFYLVLVVHAEFDVCSGNANKTRLNSRITIPTQFGLCMCTAIFILFFSLSVALVSLNCAPHYNTVYVSGFITCAQFVCMYWLLFLFDEYMLQSINNIELNWRERQHQYHNIKIARVYLCVQILYPNYFHRSFVLVHL